MNAAIYIRKSREDKDKDSHRLTVQREQLPAYAIAQGWKPHIYDDGHASAARGKAEDLKQRARLEADINAGKINIILTIELSRLSRDDSLQDYTAWLHLCGQHQVKLATLSRTLDPAQTSDWMLLLLEGGFSSVEMKIMQIRMAEGRRQAKLAGKYLGGKPPMPYTYDKAEHAVKIDPQQLKTFERIITLAHNHSARSIAEQVGLPHIRVRRIIADDRLLFYQGKRLDEQTGNEITGQWPAVIDAKTAHAIAQNRKTGHHSPRREITGMLSACGLMICQYCGRSVRTWANGKPRKSDGLKLQYYGCRHLDKKGGCGSARMIPQSVIDQLVLTNVSNTLERLDQIKTYWIDHNSTNTTAQQIKAINTELDSLQKQKQRLIDAITEGIIDFADAKEKRQQIETSSNACKKRLAELTNQTTEPPNWEDITLTRAEIDQLTKKEQRELLIAILESITIGTTTITLNYKFPRHPDGRTTAQIKLPAPGKTNPKGHWKP
ncbi:recombinase family protein [Geopsychrobacter electrodiphilus]|uniref:recombinase family protein n=1 Tax=Geopsychrobacter electrodiphilus TaxID=225196 RepID=UPI0003644822|nr:recombinase family protein [Geopsychrobacter electrodiphilus]